MFFCLKWIRNSCIVWTITTFPRFLVLPLDVLIFNLEIISVKTQNAHRHIMGLFYLRKHWTFYYNLPPAVRCSRIMFTFFTSEKHLSTEVGSTDRLAWCIHTTHCSRLFRFPSAKCHNFSSTGLFDDYTVSHVTKILRLSLTLSLYFNGF